MRFMLGQAEVDFNTRKEHSKHRAAARSDRVPLPRPEAHRFHIEFTLSEFHCRFVFVFTEQQYGQVKQN